MEDAASLLPSNERSDEPKTSVRFETIGKWRGLGQLLRDKPVLFYTYGPILFLLAALVSSCLAFDSPGVLRALDYVLCALIAILSAFLASLSQHGKINPLVCRLLASLSVFLGGIAIVGATGDTSMMEGMVHYDTGLTYVILMIVAAACVASVYHLLLVALGAAVCLTLAITLADAGAPAAAWPLIAVLGALGSIVAVKYAEDPSLPCACLEHAPADEPLHTSAATAADSKEPDLPLPPSEVATVILAATNLKLAIENTKPAEDAEELPERVRDALVRASESMNELMEADGALERVGAEWRAHAEKEASADTEPEELAEMVPLSGGVPQAVTAAVLSLLVGVCLALALTLEPEAQTYRLHDVLANHSASIDGHCSNMCDLSGDFQCDDGGDNSTYSQCEYGTDCIDCGPRVALAPSPPPLPPSQPPSQPLGWLARQFQVEGITETTETTEITEYFGGVYAALAGARHGQYHAPLVDKLLALLQADLVLLLLLIGVWRMHHLTELPALLVVAIGIVLSGMSLVLHKEWALDLPVRLATGAAWGAASLLGLVILVASLDVALGHEPHDVSNWYQLPLLLQVRGMITCLLGLLDTFTDLAVAATYFVAGKLGAACASSAILLVSGLVTTSTYVSPSMRAYDSPRRMEMSRGMAYFLGFTFLAQPYEQLMVLWRPDMRRTREITQMQREMALLESTPQLILMLTQMTLQGFRNAYKEEKVVMISAVISLFSIVQTYNRFIFSIEMDHNVIHEHLRARSGTGAVTAIFFVHQMADTILRSMSIAVFGYAVGVWGFLFSGLALVLMLLGVEVRCTHMVTDTARDT